jgi:anti-anti-sigma factor
MAADLNITVDRPRDDVLLLSLLGELDLTNASTLERELEAAVNDGRLVVVDVGGLLFIDSTGVRTLLRASMEAEQRGIRFALASPTAATRKVLRVSGLDSRFEIYGDVDAALAEVEAT